MGSKVFGAVFVLFLTVGCAAQSWTFEDIGEQVLTGFGLFGIGDFFNDSEVFFDPEKGFSIEEEYYLGRAVAAHVYSEVPPHRDSALARYVNLVGQSVLSGSTRPETFGGYHFGVLDTEEVYAISAPGGFVFVTKGMLRTLVDEDGLAMLLAHEITHVSEKHGIQAISEADKRSSLGTLAQLAGALNCNQIISQASLVFGGVATGMVENLLEKGYSREQELAADRGALEIVGRTGYDPQAMEDLLDGLDHAYVAQPAGWFDTHPSNESRRSVVAKVLEGMRARSSESARELRRARFIDAVRAL